MSDEDRRDGWRPISDVVDVWAALPIEPWELAVPPVHNRALRARNREAQARGSGKPDEKESR